MIKNKLKKVLIIILIIILLFMMFPLISIFNIFVNYAIAVEESSIVVDKYVSPVGNSSNEFLLTLEAYINGDAGEIEINKIEIPADIVLVIDQSSSMSSNKLGSVTRLEAVRTAVQDFADSVYTKALGEDGVAGTDDDVNHRMAMVGFAQSNPTKSKYENTELFIGGTEYNYLNLTSEIYSQAFQDMNTTDGKSNIDKSIDLISANKSTFVDKGVEIANGVLENNPIPEGELRERIVIVIMDGQPGSVGKWGYDTYGNNGSDGTTVANIVLPLIYETKNTYGAEVYTIGVFSSADGSTPAPTPNWADGKTSDTSKDNAFMHYLSSNFQYAKGVEEPGDPTYPEEGSYYLSALNTTELNNIFTTIYEKNVVGKGSELDESTILKDIISTNFNLPQDATTLDVKVYTAAYQGNGVFAEKVAFENAGVNIYKDETSGLDVVEVTGFDYFENCVLEVSENEGNPKGAKIIVEIPIVTANANSGGTVQYTNDSSSGIYNSTGEVLEVFLVEKFPIPAVDTPTTVTLNHIFNGTDEDAVNLDFTSDYIEFIEYVEESTETGNYLKAVGQEISKTNSLGNSDTATFSEVIVNNDFKISSDLLLGYEITKVTVDSPDIEEYELQPDENGDYTVSVINNMNITVYTEKTQKNILVQKVWEDNNNQFNCRPENVYIELLQNDNVIKEIELSEANNWEDTFSDLDIYDLDGNEYAYKVQEKNVLDEYYVKSIIQEEDKFIITNTKLGTITINKYDNSTNESLANATFKIEKQNEENLELIGEYTTDANGKIVIENLEQGLYKITEIHAPEGYKLNKENYVVNINEVNFEYVLDVPNKQQMILPATGGNGIKTIIVLGITSVIFSKVIQNKKITRKKGYNLKHHY